MDFYKLSQEDFHVLEEKINEGKNILTHKDSVRHLTANQVKLFEFRIILE